MVKFYILTSGHFTSLLRHNSPKYSNIPKEDMVVVINSLDEYYIKKAEKYCKDTGIEYYITKSNGTPAKGKNSVLKLFLESDNDYCVMVDGDDFLTQYGVEYYKNLVNNKVVPDALCLRNALSLHYLSLYHNNNIEITTKTVVASLRAEDEKFNEEEAYENYLNVFKTNSKKARKAASSLKKLHDNQKKFSEKHQTFTRVTWLSKKAAKFKFDEDLVIGEDAIQFFYLKNEGLNNNLKVFTLDENPPTYIYDQRTKGTVRTESKEHKDFSWIDKFIDKVEFLKQKNIIHENKYLKEYRVFGE